MTFYLNNVFLLSSCLEIKLNLTLSGLKMLHLMWKYLNSDDKIDAKIANVPNIFAKRNCVGQHIYLQPCIKKWHAYEIH